MNAPPLPPEERQQFVERGFHRPWRLKTEAFGSFTSFLFTWRDAEGGTRRLT